jgi:hypothetical protein
LSKRFFCSLHYKESHEVKKNAVNRSVDTKYFATKFFPTTGHPNKLAHTKKILEKDDDDNDDYDDDEHLAFHPTFCSCLITVRRELGRGLACHVRRRLRQGTMEWNGMEWWRLRAE